MPRVHIAIVGGQWHATPGNGNHATRCALVPAIRFCDRLNEQERRGKPLAAKRAARQWAAHHGTQP
jgi:hypothetical protein